MSTKKKVKAEHTKEARQIRNVTIEKKHMSKHNKRVRKVDNEHWPMEDITPLPLNAQKTVRILHTQCKESIRPSSYLTM